MVAMQVAALFPRHVAGLVLIEGWTNLRCARQLSDNFYGGLGEQQRKAIRRKSKETFARWPAGLWEPYWDSVEAADASNFLSSTDLPIIEVYGDHGHPPLPREALGVPDHPHIEVRWVTGAGHYLPLEQPESVALACRDLCGG
jgi:pimeloyl-ACP methyl ester carboxylesterase